MASPYVILEIEAAGLDADVMLNGIPVVEERAAEPTRRALKLNSWVVEGDNLIDVRLTNRPEGATAAPRFNLRLRQVEAPPSTVEDVALLEYVWTPAEPALPAGRSVLVLSRRVTLRAPKTWSWMTAPPQPTLGDEDRQSIISLLGSVEAALGAKRSAEVVALQTLSLTEQAEAVGEPPASILASYTEFLNERMSDPEWRVVPFVADALDFVSLAGGRLIHVRTTEGRPPITAVTTDSRFLIDPYVAKVTGRWTIVR